QYHSHTERRKHAGIFHSDHAAANHDECLRHVLHLQDLIAAHNGLAVQRNLGRNGRLGSAGNHERLRLAVKVLAITIGHAHMVGIGEGGNAAEDFDVVAGQLCANDVDLGFHHILPPESKVPHRNLFFDAVVDPVDVLVIEAGQVQHRLAHGFAGNGAGVYADAADPVRFLDDGDELAELGPLDRGTLSCRARPDHYQIVRL